MSKPRQQRAGIQQQQDGHHLRGGFQLADIGHRHALRVPISAIHSRSAEMAISRPMMIIAIQPSVRPICTSRIKAAATISLSATGSRKAPKAEVWPSLRAR